MMRKLLFALAFLGLAGPAFAQNYNATPGSGLVFGSKLVTSVNYPQFVFCDPATPANCVGVNASGQMTVLITGTVPLPTGAATAAKQPALGTAGTPSADVISVQGAASMTPLKTDSSATTQPVSAASLPLPTGAASSATQGTTTDTPTTLPASATAATEIALLKAIANAANSPVPLGTTGGWTPKRLSALSTTVTAVKSSAAGQLGMIQCGNTNASQGYVQIFDVATAGGVTLGTTVPNLSIPIAATNTGGYTLSLQGMQFANGIQVAATTTATGSTALGTALDCNAGFN